jgi:hypothetical protein
MFVSYEYGFVIGFAQELTVCKLAYPCFEMPEKCVIVCGSCKHQREIALFVQCTDRV